MMNRTIAGIGKFQNKKFIKARLTESIGCAAFGTIHTYAQLSLSIENPISCSSSQRRMSK